MEQSEFDATGRRLADAFHRNWWRIIIGAWLIYILLIIFGTPQFSIFGFHFGFSGRFELIQAFALPDTDDNLRMAQVRALLGGQGWYDLVQHRFDPAHGGGNIHWSRLVDLPLAAIILIMKPLVGGADAERIAVAVGPQIPLLLLMISLALTMKRLVGERSWPLPIIGLLMAYSTMGMFAPLRIDHHGWQLAFLALAVSGMADPRRARGGAVLGVATGLSLSIGLEMMIYLGLLGGATVLLWVANGEQRRRLAAYAGSLVATTGVGFLVFASEANRQAVCDALSLVWLSDAAVGGAAMLGLSMLRLDSWKARLVAAVAAGAAIVGFHALAWPHCLQRLEGVSPEATELWLDHVREAKPFYRHSWRVGATALALPVTGLIGWALLVWRATKLDHGRDLLGRTLAVALPAIAALALLFWQIRAGPAAQMMALPAATAIIALIAGPWLNAAQRWKRYAAVPIILLAFGAVVPLGLQLGPREKASPVRAKVAQANRRCPSLAALRPINAQPKGIVFTFIDLGPRLIVATHHDAIGGPYHRNDQAIADVMKAFRGNEAQARRIIAEHSSDYLLICPDMSTATIFMSEAPDGFYGQLVRGRVPAWLEPVELPKDSPFKMWKVRQPVGDSRRGS